MNDCMVQLDLVKLDQVNLGWDSLMGWVTLDRV